MIMIKKYLSIFLIFSIVNSLIFVPESAFADNSLYVTVSSASGNIGDEVKVSVSLTNVPSAGINSGFFVLEYDKSKLDFVRFDAGDIVHNKNDISYSIIDINSVYTELILANPEIFKPQHGINILYLDEEQTVTTHIRNSGILGYVVFKIKDSYISGTTVVKPNFQDIRITGAHELSAFYSDDGEIIPTKFNSGTISVINRPYDKLPATNLLTNTTTPAPVIVNGDVSNDGRFNVSGFAQMKSFLLGKIKEFKNKNWRIAGDVSGDGIIDSIDYYLMSKKILRLISKFPVDISL